MVRTRSAVVAIKWVVLGAVMLLLFVFQVMPGFLEVFGTRPVFLIPFVVCVAMFENEKAASVMALVAGALWDSVGSKLFGFSSIILAVCCVACSLLVMYLMKANLINSLALCGGCLVCYYLFNVFFYYVIWGYENIGYQILTHVLPMILFTLIITPAIYALVRWICLKFRRVLA